MIKVYIACLASYNSGYLFGKWLDLDNYNSGDEVLGAIQKEILDSELNPMLQNYGETPEEWAMHDIEGITYELAGRTEWPDMDKLLEMNEILNDDNGELILEIKDYLSADTIQEAKEFFENNHIGEFSRETELAYYIAEEINGWDLSDGLGRYFDAQQFARDLLCGDVTEIGGHYFWAC